MKALRRFWHGWRARRIAAQIRGLRRRIAILTEVAALMDEIKGTMRLRPGERLLGARALLGRLQARYCHHRRRYRLLGGKR